MAAARIAYKFVRWSGLPWLFREVLFRRGTRILTFHDPSPVAFDRALRYLRSRYSIITMADHLSGKPLPPRPVVVTLDDGHIGNHALIPVLREHGIRPVIFLCAGLVGTNRRFWFKHAGLTGSGEELKRLPDTERLRALAAIGFTPEQEYDAPHAMSVEQVNELVAVADVGSHTLFHPCLPQCDAATAAAEIADSKRRLESMLTRTVDGFAFPNGDHSPRDVRMVARAGYRYACTTDHGFNRSRGAFLLKRISVDDTGDIDAICVKASGVWGLLRVAMGRQRLNREQPALVGDGLATPRETMPIA